jgi:hypothetical protein
MEACPDQTARGMSFTFETFIFGFADPEIGSDNGVVS